MGELAEARLASSEAKQASSLLQQQVEDKSVELRRFMQTSENDAFLAREGFQANERTLRDDLETTKRELQDARREKQDMTDMYNQIYEMYMSLQTRSQEIVYTKH